MYRRCANSIIAAILYDFLLPVGWSEHWSDSIYTISLTVPISICFVDVVLGAGASTSSTDSAIILSIDKRYTKIIWLVAEKQALLLA